MPRVRVALATCDSSSKLLMVEHCKHGSCYYLLPGGGVGERETLLGALKRELSEETGLHLPLEELYSSRQLRLWFIAESISPPDHLPERHVIHVVFLLHPPLDTILSDVSDQLAKFSPADRRIKSAQMLSLQQLRHATVHPAIKHLLIELLTLHQSAPKHWFDKILETTDAYLGNCWC